MALRTRGALVAMTVAALLGAVGEPPGPGHAPPYLTGSAFPTGPVFTWIVLAATAIVCAAQERERTPKDPAHSRDYRALVVLGVGVSCIAMASLVWSMSLSGVWGPYWGNLVLGCFAAGYALSASCLFVISRQVATTGSSASALVAALFISALGVALGGLVQIATFSGLVPRLVFYVAGMGLSLGLVALAFFVAAGLRLASPMIMAGLGIGLLLVATGTALFVAPEFRAHHWQTPDLVTRVGFLALALTGAYAAARTEPVRRESEDRCRGAPPDLPLPHR